MTQPLIGRGANYVADPLAVAPGEAYTLQVTREGATITGSTRVPGPFKVAVDGLRVQWTQSVGAAEYVVRVRRYDEDGNVQYGNASPIRTQEQVIRLDTARFSDSFEPGPHAITVIAVDSNLARYRKREVVRRSGLEGGLGVFGAVTVRRDTVPVPAAELSFTN